MKEFDELIEIIDRLLAPDGCPWDREQTLQSLRSTVLEEVCEVIEAIDLNENLHIQEELGDLFFNVVFLSKIAEKEQRFPMKAILQELNNKLIRRHPHVFGEGKKIHTTAELYEQWDRIKKGEKGKDIRKGALDGISKNLPALSRAQKVLKKIKKAGYKETLSHDKNNEITNEDELGRHLLSLVKDAQEKDLDAEHALRKALAHLEKDFLRYENDHLEKKHS
jgi:MazG family protein